MKYFTPLKAIRWRCLDCSAWVRHEVRKCPLKNCQLFPYRLSKRLPAGTSSLKTIRKYCLDCQGDSNIGVKECPSHGCALFGFRFGKNPNFKISEAQREILISRLGNATPHTQHQETCKSPSEIKKMAGNSSFSEKEQ